MSQRTIRKKSTQYRLYPTQHALLLTLCSFAALLSLFSDPLSSLVSIDPQLRLIRLGYYFSFATGVLLASPNKKSAILILIIGLSLRAYFEYHSSLLKTFADIALNNLTAYTIAGIIAILIYWLNFIWPALFTYHLVAKKDAIARERELQKEQQKRDCLFGPTTIFIFILLMNYAAHHSLVFAIILLAPLSYCYLRASRVLYNSESSNTKLAPSKWLVYGCIAEAIYLIIIILTGS